MTGLIIALVIIILWLGYCLRQSILQLWETEADLDGVTTQAGMLLDLVAQLDDQLNRAQEIILTLEAPEALASYAPCGTMH